jgi:chemotaxis protein methyltransferase CheR
VRRELVPVTLPLPPPVFMILRTLIEERFGMRYAPEDAPILAAKVTPLALELGLASLLDYYYHLRYDESGDEMDRLADALVVNESFFFREHAQLRVLCDEVIAPRIAAGARARIWSAACASGEEPCTIAMMLASRGLLDSVDIVATDISRIALDRARRGELGVRSVRDVPEPAVAARFLERTDRGVKVSRDIVDRIRFERANLLDPSTTEALGSFDVILCRNVLIYFSDVTVQRVMRHLSDRLVDGGVLAVAATESLMRWGGSLVCEERSGSFFYRKASA